MKKVGRPSVTCVRRTSHLQCVQAIAANKADAVTLEGSLMFEAGLAPFNLRPVAAEFYETRESEFSLGAGKLVALALGLCTLRVGPWTASHFEGTESLRPLGQILPHWGRTCLLPGETAGSTTKVNVWFLFPSAEQPQIYNYALAIVKKASSFQLSQLQGVKACLPGTGSTTGWNIPMGVLRRFLNWAGPPEPLQRGEVAGVGCGRSQAGVSLLAAYTGHLETTPAAGGAGSSAASAALQGGCRAWAHQQSECPPSREAVREGWMLTGKPASARPGCGGGWLMPRRMPLRPTAAAEFFSASCAPCVDGNQYPSLCRLCAGTAANKCVCSSKEPYFGDLGAFQCLKDGAGEVAFVNERVLFESPPDRVDWDQYELLCPDNTRRPVQAYKDCHLARVPSHTVVARSSSGMDDLIWELLRRAQERFGKGKSSAFALFGSPPGQKDLLFRDSASGFLRIPRGIDSALYLGPSFLTAMRNLRKKERAGQPEQVVWCAVGSDELRKCTRWSGLSDGVVACASAPSPEGCIELVLKGEADAMSLDGGYIYVAGKCGLVPVLAENRKSNKRNSDCVQKPDEGYLGVAVVRKSNVGLTWNSLRGRKSCHTAVGRTAGWNIPMGLLFNQTGSCRFGKESRGAGGGRLSGAGVLCCDACDEFFSQSCAPGAEPSSSLCTLCIGDAQGKHRCAANSSERYQGYTGAFRCLVSNAGDVAFVKDSTVLDNTNGKNTAAWAEGLKLEDFELLCLDGSRKPVTEAQNCHLAVAPNHAVVSRREKAGLVEEVLLQQQAQFGRNGRDCPGKFCLFQSETKNLLFNDNTECLARLQGKTTYEKYLGQDYVTAVANLRQCSTSRK
ncbi:Lactotransferrin [Galemys pyrenaicus]|uniref:Lactotransferrin n=1 Tax=Galemys pyrenaicus TaxID=202257 RepID=A0A8J6AIS6_GALPY|nr:Lactotransferrin [Galemys pyrenaicus]